MNTDPAPRHRRRQAARAARAAFDEARHAGLVQRHRLKLHHLAVRARADHPDPPAPTGSPPDGIPEPRERPAAPEAA